MAAEADQKLAAPAAAPPDVSPAAAAPSAAAAAPPVAASPGAQALLGELGAARSHLVAGRLAEAEQGYRRLLAVSPAIAQALHELGVCRHRQDDNEGAIVLIGQAVQLAPEVAEFHSNLGVMQRAAGRFAEAEAALRRALALRPGYALAAANLGNLLMSDGRAADAAESYRIALQSEPDSADIRFALATALMELNRIADAETELRTLVARHPGVARYHINLSKALQRGGKLVEAEAACQAGLALAPSAAYDDANAAYLSIVGHLGRFAARDAVRARLEAAVPAEPVEIPAYKRFAYLLPYYGIDDARHLDVLRRLGEAVQRSVPIGTPADPGAPPPLRVGFLSGDFGDHPIGHLLSPVFEALDRTRVQSCLYSIGSRAAETSPFRQRLKRAAFQFRALEGQALGACAEAIRADRLHVLIDLNGYLAGGMPELLARRLAPLQIHWIMHLGGMPAPFVDYTITDGVVVPDGALAPARGPLIRLPDAFQAGDRHPIPDIAANPGDHGLPARGFVYCGFNNRLKLDTGAFDAWMQILRGVPGSALWLSAAADPAAEDELRAAARMRGVDPARLVLAGRVVDKGEHLARHRFAGLFLDTFGFGAATTATDALWAGVPVLTRQATVCHGRIGESLLRAVGMPELVMPDTAAYVARAIEIGRDTKLATRLRRRLLKQLHDAPYFDARRFAHGLETALLAAWQRTAAGQRASFDIRS